MALPPAWPTTSSGSDCGRLPCSFYRAQASSAFLTINPNPSSVRVNCIFAPTTPVWAFNTLGAGTYAFNASSSNNFQLDISEEFNIVIGILKYAGVIINDPTVIEVAAQEAQQVEANEKS